MNLLSWNCRGLRNAEAVRELRNLLRRNKISIAFLCETKLSGFDFDSLKTQLDLFGVAVGSQGRRGNSGGLALLWNKDIKVDLNYYSSRYIDAFCYVNGEKI